MNFRKILDSLHRNQVSDSGSRCEMGTRPVAFWPFVASDSRWAYVSGEYVIIAPKNEKLDLKRVDLIQDDSKN